MANTQFSKPRQEEIVIDTAPPAAGSFTKPVNVDDKKAPNVYFSIRETGDSSTFTATITLQWRQRSAEDDSWEDWQDYDTYTSIQRKLIDDHTPNVQYRAGVKNGNYTSGEVKIGFNW